MVYVDLLILLNICYDYLLLLTVGVTLKRRVSHKRLFWAALFGSVSIILIFFDVSKVLEVVLKNLLGVPMLVVAFGYKNVVYTFYNILYLYMSSVVLAGFLYYLTEELGVSYGNVNYVALLVIAPLVLGVYTYSVKKLRCKQNLAYKIKVVFKNNNILLLDGFIDSGNKLRDPVTNKYVIIVDKNVYSGKNPIYVPFKGVNKTGILKCFSLDYIEINNQVFKNYLLGVSNESINLDGSNCILNYKLLEEINV